MKSKAFTLIELLVVIASIGILAVALAPMVVDDGVVKPTQDCEVYKSVTVTSVPKSCLKYFMNQ